jgi:hypothetical protein
VQLAAVWGLSGWLATGLGLAVVFTLVVAAVFAVAERRYPSPQQVAGARVGGETRRRREIREYLDAIGESYAEDHPVAGDEVAFYLPGRGVAITFDAEAFFRIQHTATVPVLVEEEMPGYHLGARLPFEVPEVEYGPSADAKSREVEATVEAAFARLDLSRHAGPDAVKAAYRDRVKDVHPDHGGSEDAFRRLREAYVKARDHAAD